MPNKIRLKRISDTIKEELAQMLIREIQDPALSGVSITDVIVDREFSYADIFVSALEGQARAKEILAAFRRASGYIRKNLAERVDLRVFPQLRFRWDPTPEKADRIERLMASLHDEGSPPAEIEEEEEENGG